VLLTRSSQHQNHYLALNSFRIPAQLREQHADQDETASGY